MSKCDIIEPTIQWKLTDMMYSCQDHACYFTVHLHIAYEMNVQNRGIAQHLKIPITNERPVEMFNLIPSFLHRYTSTSHK